MFQFENAEYQNILETSMKRTSRYAEDSKKALADLQEFLEGLTRREVDFLLALRKCDYRLRTELYHSLSFWCKGRIEFYRGLAVIMETEQFANMLEDLTKE